MYLSEHFQNYLNYPALNTGITLFYCLIVVAMIQAAKWHYAAIVFALFISGALLLAALYSLPHDLLGTGGGVAIKQEAKDIFIVAIGALLGVLASILVRIFRKLF